MQSILSPQCPICKSHSSLFTKKNNYQLYKCSGCELGFLDPLPTQEAVDKYCNNKNYYESTEHGYLNYSALEKGLKKTYRGFIGKIYNKYSFNLSGKNVLDIGCAHGYFLDTAKESGANELWGIDIS